MPNTLTDRHRTEVEAPEDLRIFGERLSRHGIRITLPTAGPADPLPPLVKVEGVPLSELIIQAREAGAEV